jgi:transposase
MGEARVIRADRSQLRWDMVDLEGLVAGDHRVRSVWAFVETLDMSAFYAKILSRDGEAGRPAADPRVLLALWIYALVEGVGSARELERRVERDVAYRWLAGEVPVNYHGLADFRVEHGDALDRLLTQSVTALISANLVTLETIAIDGTKLRANAGRKSFKGEERLSQIETKVAERVRTLKAELASDGAASSRRLQAARERAAREMQERTARAQAALTQLQAEREARAKTHAKDEAKKKPPKVSLSDPEARFMSFADGAKRPGYNAQIGACPATGVIVSIEVTDRRNDQGLTQARVDDIVRRYEKAPRQVLVDAGYKPDIAALAGHPERPVEIYAPVPEERQDVKPDTLYRRQRARLKEPACVRAWRERMQSAAGELAMIARLGIERVNAACKNRGFADIPVRGLVKAQAFARLHALANNFMAGERLRTSTAAA